MLDALCPTTGDNNQAESVVAEDAHSLSKYFEFLYNKINPSGEIVLRLNDDR